MTESEIMKALEWCELFTDNIVLSNKKGEKFTFALQSLQTIKQVLKDYNRKNAEIEELQHEKTELQHKIEKLNFENLQMVASIKGLEARAIKEFAERVKLKVEEPWLYGKNAICRILDQIAKEMGVEL